MSNVETIELWGLKLSKDNNGNIQIDYTNNHNVNIDRKHMVINIKYREIKNGGD